MRDVKHQLRDYWSEITSDLPEPSLEAARQEQLGDGSVRPIQQRRPTRHRPAWAVAVAALVGVMLVGASAWLLGVGRDSTPVADLGPGDTTLNTSPTATTLPGTVTIEISEWNPVLAETRAGLAPPAATCSTNTSPGPTGPSDQERPLSVSHIGLTAAFDQHAGLIVYIDAAGTTWTFDVCTSTWQDMDPQGDPYETERDLFDAAGDPSGVIGDLVYDVDSDRTVEFGQRAVHVYDANTNTWTLTASDYDSVRDDFHPVGAVYDPVSGLIVTTSSGPNDRWEVWAYDVDTDTWTSVGSVSLDRTTPCCTGIDLLGYSQQLDRLILTTYPTVPDEDPSLEELTLLLDPRTGTIELLPTPSPVVDLRWPSHSYGQAADTVFVNGWSPSSRYGICGFDTETGEWTRCLDTPLGPQARVYAGFGAMVDDPINDRLVLINGLYGDFWVETDGAVWAIDLDSGNVLTLVAPADGSTNTITVVLDELEGYGGLVVNSWVLPTDPTVEKIAFGGTYSEPIDQDPFSASDVMHPQNTRYWEIVDREVASFEPGTYRFVIEVFKPSGPMRYGCEMPIEVVEGEALTITISELPQYTGGGWHWTLYDQLQYPDCPESVRVDTGV